jgi:hypothetical protein
MKKILLILPVLLLMPILAATAASFNGFNEKCQLAPTAPEEWTIEKIFRFTHQGNSFKLVYSRTVDAGGSLCLITGKSANPVGAKYWQSEYIDRVDRVSAKIFTFQIHQGNGNNTPVKKYQLDLTRPQGPKVVLLKEWIDP